MRRLVGVDLGERRIGLAIGDIAGGAVPLATIRRASDAARDAASIRRALGSLKVDELVVGLPLEMRSGDEGAQAAATRSWAEVIGPALGLDVVYRDERLSSQAAEQRIGPMRRGRSGGAPTASQREAHRARVDREAAAIILQAELDARAAEPRAALGGTRPPGHGEAAPEERG